MESRQRSTPTLPFNLVSVLLFGLVLLFSQCKSDPEAPAPDQSSTENPRNGVPDQINGMDVTKVEQIAGGLKDFGDRDLKAEGRQLAQLDATSEGTGFAGISPCAVLKIQDLGAWPGTPVNMSTQRNNLGNEVMGCVYSLPGRDGKGTGSVSVYFSDNQEPSLAKGSIDQMIADPRNQLKSISDWDLPAAYNPKAGEFVWASGSMAVTLVVSGIADATAKDKMVRDLATKIETKLAELR